MSTPAGWYADPTDPSRTRWWDGAQWTEHTAPLPAPTPEPAAAPALAPEPAAPEPAPEPAAPEPAPTPEPAAPEPATEPAAPTAPPVPPQPRYGEYAPTVPATAPQPGTAAGYPAAPGYAAAAAYPAAPTWPQAAPPVAAGPSAPGANTHTLWIYLCIAAATLPILSLFLIDWSDYLRAIVAVEYRGSGADPQAVAAMVDWFGRTMLVSVLSYVAIAASIVFAWLDWRELKKRGVARPFHWGFAFFALIISIGVYIIGRTVVLRRETGSGLTALWVWLGSIALTVIVSLLWFAWFWQQLTTLITTYGV